MPARQAYTGIHRQKAEPVSQPARDSSSSSSSGKQHSTTQTQALTMYLYLCIFCIGVCICVSFIRYVRSVRFVGLFALCAQSRGNSTTHTHHHTRTRTCTRIHTLPTYVCIWLWYWPGRAFIVCVAEQKFCCSLYEHTATAVAAAARASSWAVAGHMKRWWWGGGRVRVRPTATSTEYGRLTACLLGLPCAKRFAPNSHAVE